MVCLVLICAGATVWASGRVALDDAFIAYRYASQLAHGHGLVFNAGERVEGYTDPLWVLLGAAAIGTGIDPFTATAAVGLVSYLACVGLALMTTLRVAESADSESRGSSIAPDGRTRPDSGVWVAIGIVLLVSVLVATREVPRIAGAGLETFFVSACVLSMGVALHFNASSKRADIYGSMFALAAVLTRPDALLGVAASAIASLASRPRSIAATFSRRYALPVLGMIALTAWRLWYYGALLPNSYFAKAADGWHIRAGLKYVESYARNSPYVGVLVLLAAFGLAAAWRSAWRGWQVFLCTFAVLHALYVVKVGGDFMSYRFMFEALPLLVCAGGVGLAFRPFSDGRVLAATGAACMALSFAPPKLEHSYAMQSLEEMNSYVVIGRETGQRLKAVLPPDTIIATTLAGTVPYFSGLPTIDEWGLNDRFVASQPPPPRFRRGHVKHATIDYLVDRDVNLVIDHPVVCSCAQPCAVEGVPQVFVRLSEDRCLRTAYLVQQPALTRHMCADPADFVLRNVACP